MSAIATRSAVGVLVAGLLLVAPTQIAAADEQCFNSELVEIPCPTTTIPPTTTTNPPTTTTTTIPPTTTTTTTTTTTVAPTTTRAPNTTSTTEAPATTTTSEPPVVTIAVDQNPSSTAGEAIATTTAAPSSTVAPSQGPSGTTSVTPSTTTTDAPVISTQDEDQEQATGIITGAGPRTTSGGNSTQIVWIILIALNVVMIAAVSVRRRLRRMSRLGTFERA